MEREGEREREREKRKRKKKNESSGNILLQKKKEFQGNTKTDKILYKRLLST